MAESSKVVPFDQLKPLGRFVNLKGTCYKTVDTFAGITQRKLWLVDGYPPSTNGYEICVPLKDANAYRFTEHELSHVLFRSDAVAKKQFTVSYTKRVVASVKKAKATLDPRGVSSVVGQIINIVEDHRCDKLWGRIYPGSFRLKKEMDLEYLKDMGPAAAESVLVYFGCLEAGVDIPPCKNDRFRPYLIEALRKVEGRGFAATLIVSKWLVTVLVNEIIRESQGQESPPDFPDECVVVGIPEPGGGDADDDSQDGSQGAAGQGAGDHVDVGDGEDVEADGADSGGSGLQAASAEPSLGGQGNGQSPWEPPDVTASVKERIEALQNLVHRMEPHKDRPLDNDVKEPKYQAWKDKKKTEDAVNEAVRAQVKDSDKMESLLDKSAAEMDKILEEADKAIKASMTEDDYIRKDAMARLVFRDVRRSDVEGTLEPMPADDQETVRRLRGIFNKIMGRRKTTLEDCGVEIDPGAWIEAMTTGVPVPCFKHEERGRGFKAMILLDRSSSMHGERTKKAERACRIIGRALRYPFVDLVVWGFQSLENGQVDISRFDPRLELFSSPKSNVRGVTPLHVAMRVGAKHLERGTESKQLFCITDGWPVYASRDGHNFSKRQLMFFVREDVRKAKRHGINVTGVLIKSDGFGNMAPRELAYMFGRRECWRIMSDDRFGSDLVQLVSGSFIHYLKTM